MTAPRHLPAALFALGAVTIAAALVWWSLTFEPTISNDYLSVAEASRCLLADSSLCHLATSLCGARHAALVAAYSPVLLWSGAAVAFCGLWPASRRAAPAGIAERGSGGHQGRR